jgi:hypothetical protein
MEVRLSASAIIEWEYQRSLFEALGRVEHKARFVICYQKQPSSILCSSPSSRLMNLSSMIRVSWPPQAANQDATRKTTAITQDGYFRATGRRGSIALSVLGDSAQRFTSITPLVLRQLESSIAFALSQRLSPSNSRKTLRHCESSANMVSDIITSS